MDNFTQASGKMMSDVEKGLTSGQPEKFTKENLKMGRKTEWESGSTSEKN